MAKLSDGVKLFILIYVLIMAPIVLAIFIDFETVRVPDIIVCPSAEELK